METELATSLPLRMKRGAAVEARQLLMVGGETEQEKPLDETGRGQAVSTAGIGSKGGAVKSHSS